MCGIAGILGDGAREVALLSRMGGRLRHRGPDDEGVWLDPEAGIGLAHRRLAIVDLTAAGHQPMLSRDGRYVLSFNGEIYNHAAIRAELEAAGHAPEGSWRGHSDTETLLQAIASWGLKGALEKSVGMFAISLWDRRRRVLGLARDRFGEKPLYYGWAGRDFVFGSELKALREHPAFDPAVDRRALALFVSRGYVPAPLSIYRGVFKLEPGCILEISAEAAREPRSEPPRLERYWSYRDMLRAGLADPIHAEADALDALDQALSDAVAGQSVADVPVGAFLSGGIDSSAVCALYQRHSSRPIRTFTIGFEDAAFNEADDARAVARHLGTDHHERIVTAREAREVIPRLPEIYDEPFADSSQVPTFLVSAFAREQVKVSLSGDGGDELFGGYNRYVATARLWSRLKLLPGPARAAAGAALGRVPPSAWNRIGSGLGRRQLPSSFGAKTRKWFETAGRARSLDDVVRAFLDGWPETPVLGADALPAAFDLDVAGAPDALRLMHCDTVGYLPDDILCKVDRASMAVGLESRVPFLDHRLAAVAARIPMDLKIRGRTGKHILRELLYREAPRQLFERPKAGFAIPLGDWLRGPLRDWAEALIEPRRLAREGWFDPAMVERRWQAHLDRKADSAAALWSVLMFQAWQEGANTPLTAAIPLPLGNSRGQVH